MYRYMFFFANPAHQHLIILIIRSASHISLLRLGQERIVHEIPMEAPRARSAAGSGGGARPHAPSRMKVRLRIPGHRWSAFKEIRARDDDAAERDEAVELRDDRWHIGVDSKYLRREDGAPAWTPASGGVRPRVRTSLNLRGDASCELSVFCRYWFSDLSGLEGGLVLGAPCATLALRNGSGGRDALRCVAPSAMQTAPVLVCVRESQRLRGVAWVAPYEFSDPPQWINDDDDAVEMDRIPLPDMALWRWDSDWEVDRSRGGDADGWV